MRRYYSNGGTTLTKAQKTLPAELKKKILASKKKTNMKTAKKPSPRTKAMGIA
jgi:hypothetical protein